MTVHSKIAWCAIGGIVIGLVGWLAFGLFYQPVVQAPSGEEVNKITEPTAPPGDIIPTEPLPN